MKRLITSALLVLALFAGIGSHAFAGDLENLAGKWSMSGTNENGLTYTATVEFTGNKFIFKMIDSDKKTFLYAKGDIKLDKCGELKTLTFFNIEGGQNPDELTAVDDDRHMIYVLDGDTVTLGANFDHYRDKGPRIDIYTRMKK